MLRGKLQHSKWYTRIALWLIVMMLCTIVTLFIWGAVGDSTSTDSLKWLQFWQTLTVFILPALISVYLWAEHPFKWLHLNHGMTWKTALIAIAIMLLAVPAINLFSQLNQQLILPDFLAPIETWMREQESAAQELTERFLQVDSLSGLLMLLGLMALLPAIGEELTFRGVLQGLFTPRYQTAAIWISAAIFSFIHFQFYGFIPRMLMGALFGYMLVWTGSIWVPMLMHFTNNAVAVISYYVTYHYALDSKWMEEFGSGNTWYVGVISLVVVTIICYFFSRERS